MDYESDDDDEYDYSSDGGLSASETAMDWDTSNENPNAAPMKIKGTKAPISMKKANDIFPEMDRLSADVSEALGITQATAFPLLRAADWSKEKLLSRFFSETGGIVKSAGVVARCAGAPPPPTGKGTFSCPICYDDSSRVLTMPCGHAFCMDCWAEFCENAVNEGPSCVLKTCPQAECTEVVTLKEMSTALGESSPVLQKYKTYQLRSFVESNPLFRWCPGRGCELIAAAISLSALESEGKVVSCDGCCTSFCLECGEEPHSPATCTSLAAWQDKCANESQTANWILANTKSCPNCRSRIEKNQGCNHMTCQKCRSEFCWICMGDWKSHGADTGGYYKCNKFAGNEPGEALNDVDRAKRELDRYLHFYQRYHAHDEGQKFAHKQLVATEERMVQLQETSDDSRWSDVEFLKTANEQLVECRRVLKYTYVFGYFLLPTPQNAMQRARYETHQEMLERFTESLSHISELPLDQMNRTDVVNKTRVVDNFVKNMLEYVDSGMDDDGGR